MDPKNKTLKAHFFADGKTNIHIYAATDKAEVSIFPGFAVDLETVFAEDV